MFLASAMVSGRFVLKVSGRNNTIDPESTEMPPNIITGSDVIRRACEPYQRLVNLSNILCLLLRCVVSVNLALTSNGVCGAVIDPIYPLAAQIPIKLCLKLVGNNSVVYT